MQDFTGVPAVVDLAAMRDAMTALGGDRAEDQSARPGPSRHRSQRDGRRVRHAQGVRAERRARISAQHRALPVPEMGRGRVRQFRGRAARHRHLPPGQSRIYRARRLEHAEVGAAGGDRRSEADRRAERASARPTGAKAGPRADRARPRSPIPTRWSAPTATPPWSTASACSAGASAGSRRRRRCSASRSR